MRNIDPRIIQICDTLAAMTNNAVTSDEVYSKL